MSQRVLENYKPCVIMAEDPYDRYTNIAKKSFARFSHTLNH